VQHQSALADGTDAEQAVAAAIQVLVDELEVDQYSLEGLTVQDWTDTQYRYNVGWLERFHQKGQQLWRLRLLELDEDELRNAGLNPRTNWSGYRIIYGVKFTTKNIWLLAVMARNVNYDERHPIIRRAQHEFDSRACR
jgi:hypothetical protein